MTNKRATTYVNIFMHWIIRPMLLIAMIFLFLSFGSAAESDAEVSESPIVSINQADIPARASAERASIDLGEELLDRSVIFDQLEKILLDNEKSISHDLVSLSQVLAVASSREAISEIEKKWLEYDRIVEAVEIKLRQRTGVIQQQIERLDVALELWRLTIKDAQETKTPIEVINLASATADDVAKISKSLHKLQNRALAMQAKAGRIRAGVKRSLDRVQAEESSLLNNLTRHERPPLWDEVFADITVSKLYANAKREVVDWFASNVAFIKGQYDRLAFQFFLLIVLTLLLRRARTAARVWTNADPSIAKGMSVFERPFAFSALLVLILTPWFYVYTPPTIIDAVGLLLVIPVLALVIPLLEQSAKPALILLAVLYVVEQFRDLVEAAPLVARFIFILEMIVALAIIIWVLRSTIWQRDVTSRRAIRWWSIIRISLNAALILFIVAILAVIAGYVRLGVLLGTGVLNSIYLALLLVALERTAESIIKLFLHSRFIQTFNVLKTRTLFLRKRIEVLLVLGVLAVWIFSVFDFFALRDYILALAKEILFTEFRTGAIAVSLIDILAFTITIIVAVMLARAIVLVLDEDVYPRMELGRGVAFAISSVTKYGIILLGFLVAVGAMGIGMDKITILLGAFGVGLGFGLQTVVNNFVSGMILIFERPVQIGDSVEIGSVKGRITRIGIRSSTVRSFDGADITVPNGNLLSDALTNWTMTDRNRRIEIPVGVAYGTDPDLVIKTLQGAIEGHAGILKAPAPQIIFNGFGDNSLDFLLRAWVAENDEFVTIRSNVALAMNRVLTERGIEIPFPQRDIHLRSISPEIKLPGRN